MDNNTDEFMQRIQVKQAWVTGYAIRTARFELKPEGRGSAQMGGSAIRDQRNQNVTAEMQNKSVIVGDHW